MARAPILTLADVSLSFGGDPLFSGVSLAVEAGARLCLVGRNGSGKSTLLKIAAGLVEPDRGARFVQPGAAVGYLAQEPDFTGFATLGAWTAEGLAPEERWRAEAEMDAFAVKAAADPASASGGERRRAALARLFAHAPDLLLLDEPTNHLDIAAIEALEARLSETRAGFALISHDRALLKRVTRQTLWVDRGSIRRLERGFDGFEAWRDKTLEEEADAAHKLDRLIAQEAKWAVEGISARRTRNQGRLRRLQALRAERSGRVGPTGVAAMALDAAPASGRLAIEARDVSKAYGGAPVIRGFSTRIRRGDRVALIGPNGAGKTTLLKLLTGEQSPEDGSVRLGTGLEIAVFDQSRAALDPDATLWETLTGAAALGVSGRNDQIMVRGRPKHVVGYLKEFLFDERQARGPVRALSGGERARLLLSMIMAKPANLLVLDEPTNDLDVETLDLLQELVADFDGAALVVSHDRDFIDNVATSVIAFEGEGRLTEYAGGYSDHLAQRSGAGGEAAKGAAPQRPPAPAAEPRAPKARSKLGFNEARRLEALPGEIEKLEREIAKLEALLSDPDLYAQAPERFAKATAALTLRQETKAAAEEEWLELEALRETLEG